MKSKMCKNRFLGVAFSFSLLVLGNYSFDMNGYSTHHKFRWSSFKGQPTRELQPKCFGHERSSRLSSLVMRKQKASDKRTRRLQREGRNSDDDNLGSSSFTNPHGPSFPKRIRSPMADSAWSQRSMLSPKARITKGRGRSRKRTNKYESLSTYHAEFLNLLTAEYLAEVRIDSGPDSFLLLSKFFLTPFLIDCHALYIFRRKKLLGALKHL